MFYPIAMQLTEFIEGFVLLAAAFCGWGLIWLVRSRSKVLKVVGRVSGGGILALSFCLLLFYGYAISKRYRSAPSFAPDRKYIAQITEVDFGPGPADTEVELRSRWQVFPESVFASHRDRRNVEANWLSDSNLVIRYAAGYPSDPDYPATCEQQFKSVKITCEPVPGYALHPDPTALRGQQLRAAIDQRYAVLSDAHIKKENTVQITDVLLTYISEGSSYLQALQTLMAAGFLLNRQSPNKDVGQYSVQSTCQADVNVVLQWHGPTDSGIVQKVNGWVNLTCP